MDEAKKLKYVPWIVGLGLFIENIDVTVINTSLPQMARTLNTDPIDLKIGITSYLLTLAMIIPVSGYIADRIGTKRTFLLAILIFMLGSVICGFATGLYSIIAGRLIQGAGGAIMAPVGRLILTKMFPRSAFVHVFSYLVILGQVGSVIGPVIGGVITNFLDWRYVFFINIPIGIIALILVSKFIDNIVEDVKVPFDTIGFFLFGIASSLVLFPLTLLTQRLPVHHVRVEYFLLAFGLSLFLLYYFHAKRTEHPSIDLKLLNVRTFRISTIGNFFVRIALGGIPFMLPLMFQLNFGLNVFNASLLLLPYGVGFLCAKFILKRVLNKFGFKKLLVINTFFISFLLFLFSFHAEFELTFVCILLYIFGALTSLQFSFMNILNFADIEWEKLSKATSLSSVVQQFSIGLGVCLVAGALIMFNPMSETTLNTLDSEPFISFEAFRYTFYILSTLVLLSLFSFIQLKNNDGYKVLKK